MIPAQRERAARHICPKFGFSPPKWQSAGLDMQKPWLSPPGQKSKSLLVTRKTDTIGLGELRGGRPAPKGELAIAKRARRQQSAAHSISDRS